MERIKKFDNRGKLRTIELNRLNVEDKLIYKVDIKCMLFSCSKSNVS